MSDFSVAERRAFRVLFEKGPVGYERVQTQVERARRLVDRYLLPAEQANLGTARSHALDVGEGRREWDEVCERIRQRLGLEGLT